MRLPFYISHFNWVLVPLVLIILVRAVVHWKKCVKAHPADAAAPTTKDEITAIFPLVTAFSVSSLVTRPLVFLTSWRIWAKTVS